MPKGKHFRSEELRLRISLSMKGKKLSPESIAKRSKTRTGVKLSQEHKDAISKGKIGFKSNTWKGGITPEIIIIRCRAKYKEWRRLVLERDNHNCVMCGEQNKRLVVHHIKSFMDNPDLRFDIDNGRTLCDKCHYSTPDYGWKKYHAANKGSDKYKQVNTQKKAVLVFGIEGNFIKEYESRNETARKLNINSSTVSACLKNRMKKFNNYVFKYK